MDNINITDSSKKIYEFLNFSKCKPFLSMLNIKRFSMPSIDKVVEVFKSNSDYFFYNYICIFSIFFSICSILLNWVIILVLGICYFVWKVNNKPEIFGISSKYIMYIGIILGIAFAKSNFFLSIGISYFIIISHSIFYKPLNENNQDNDHIAFEENNANINLNNDNFNNYKEF